MSRGTLSRERILEAALGLADEHGIESVTMRRLGRELGVEAMSLYNHVANKDDILDGIVNLVLDEIELPSATEPWDIALRRCAISAHEAFMRHPWACSLAMVPSGGAGRTARMRYIEALLRRLREAGFSPDLTYHAYHVLDGHILGFTMWELGHAFAVEDNADLAETFMRVLSGGDYPYLTEHAEQHGSGSHDGEGGFEFGLDLILDGLKRAAGAPSRP